MPNFKMTVNKQKKNIKNKKKNLYFLEFEDNRNTWNLNCEMRS